ncbi:hypothetical protein P3T76_005951 [Phytophthora citrophthora]|uniref:RxLR effector protein n=1 Tax=Phytophthora citrophthora TaxID=4793 RepID=A0AAD9GPP6_9STRA|nr:hypothetical protein P3T76_005951 [Phytophthora citrophthora]
MQLIQLFLVIMLVLMGTSGDFATAAKCDVKTATTDNLRASEPIQVMNLSASPDTTTATEEERAGANPGAAARVIGGASVPINGPVETATGKLVTVTKYNDNGLFQRMGKWWDSTFSRSRRLRQ